MMRRTRILLSLIVLMMTAIRGTQATGNIGCLFSNTLCEDEWCYDDHAFGRCFPVSGDIKEEALVRYHLNTGDLHSLEAEMQRLYHLGYRWSHTYTQCVLQDLLQALHQGTTFDVTRCNGQLDQDLEGALRAIEGEEQQESVNPRNLAIVKFTPSALDPHTTYADELYFPAIQGGKLLPAPYKGADKNGTKSSPEEHQQTTSEENSKPLKGFTTSDISNAAKSLKISGYHPKTGAAPQKHAFKSGSSTHQFPEVEDMSGAPYDPYELDYDLFPVSDKVEIFYDYPKDAMGENLHHGPKEFKTINTLFGDDGSANGYGAYGHGGYMPSGHYGNDGYPANNGGYNRYVGDPGYDSDGYLSDQGYQGFGNDGYMSDQGYGYGGYMSDEGYKAHETNDIGFQDSHPKPIVPTPQPMSNKEYMRHLGLYVPEGEDYDSTDKEEFDVPSSPYRSAPMYRKRTNLTDGQQPLHSGRRFSLGSFLRNFNEYLKKEQEAKEDASGSDGKSKGELSDVTSNQSKREDFREQIKPLKGITSSKMRELQEKLDPQLRENFVNAAIDVMRRNRDKPQYNSAELRKIAALLDEIRQVNLEHGPIKDDSANTSPRFVERKETEPVYVKPILPMRSVGNPEQPMDPSQHELNFDGDSGGYLRVDKAIPLSPNRPYYPPFGRGFPEDRYDYRQHQPVFYAPHNAEDLGVGGVDGGDGGGSLNTATEDGGDEDGNGGFDGGYDGGYGGGYYYGPPVIPYGGGVGYYHHPPFPAAQPSQGDNPEYLRFGSQMNFPHFYKPEEYGMPYGGGEGYDYRTGEDGDDQDNYGKKEEESEDSVYGTMLGSDGKPLPHNFVRPERIDVKKPGPYYGQNPHPMEESAYVSSPGYDHYRYNHDPRRFYRDYDPYNYYYEPYFHDYDVDTVGGEPDGAGYYMSDDGSHPGGKARYVDESGNEIDIGMAMGNGGVFPMARSFSEVLEEKGLEGDSLHPGPDYFLHRPYGGGPDMFLAEERLVDNISRGIGPDQPHHNMMLHPAMGALRYPGYHHPMPMLGAAPNNTRLRQGHIPKGSNSTDQQHNPPYIYIDANVTFMDSEARDMAGIILQSAGLSRSDIDDIRVQDNRMMFSLKNNNKGITEEDVADKALAMRDQILRSYNVTIFDVSVARSEGEFINSGASDNSLMVGAAVVSGVMAAVVVAAAGLLVLRRHAARRSKLRGLSNRDTEASKDYQDLCRARMAAKNKALQGNEKDTSLPGTHAATGQRISSLSKESDNGGNSPGSRSSTSSWSEEPVAPNMDISTGHMVLSYMEDHLKNKSRLEQEWVALCAYEAEPSATMVAKKPTNQKKNRYPAVLPYDHNRVHLNQQANISGSDYINASSITDHDPRNPAYIATQGPLATTTADFWQLVWEQGSVVIVMLTRLNENSHTLCHHYWPQEGSQLYHIYEVHLVSEHIWCDDYLVRSFYLKNTRTGDTRTVTQFHFLSWPDTAIPASTKALLEFRRKVNKSYRGRSCPIIVHCSDGIGRAGTYILIDMVLNRMAKGAKEIDIAATLEHIRDQRANMVTTKLQFEFVLMAVAEEVHAILKALPQ